MANPANNNKPRYNPWLLYTGIIFIILAISLTSNGGGFGDNKAITLSKFYEFLDQGDVEKVVFNNSTAKVYISSGAMESNHEHQTTIKPSFFNSRSEEHTSELQSRPHLV